MARTEAGNAKIISLNEFLEVWNAFAAEIRELGKKSLYLLMTQNTPECVANNVFHIKVATETLKETFNLEKAQLVDRISETFATNNFEIRVGVETPDDEEKNKFLATPKEKFDHMAQINPELKNLMDELGLDFNF